MERPCDIPVIIGNFHRNWGAVRLRNSSDPFSNATIFDHKLGPALPWVGSNRLCREALHDPEAAASRCRRPPPTEASSQAKNGKLKAENCFSSNQTTPANLLIHKDASMAQVSKYRPPNLLAMEISPLPNFPQKRQ